MTYDFKIFTFEENEVRVVTINNAQWFVAKDVCEVFGDAHYRRSVSRLDEDEKGVTPLVTRGGTQEMTIVNEPGLYTLLFNMQPQKKETISEEKYNERVESLRRFKRWVTHDVLPAIRKTGGYVYDDELFINTYLVHADEQTKLLFKTTLNTVRLQNEKIAILQPKANKYDQFLDSEGYMSMNDVAKILNDTVNGIGRNLLFEFLRHKGILMSNNTPYQKYMTQGRFKITEKPAPNGHTNKVTLCTVKGFDFIANLVTEGYAEWKEDKRKVAANI